MISKSLLSGGLRSIISPTEVADAVKDEFGIVVSRQQVRVYNPLQNRQISKKWKELLRTSESDSSKRSNPLGLRIRVIG
jgi:hypothetical protein